MGNERTGRSATRNRLQGRSFHLGISSLVERVTKGADDGRTLLESRLNAIVDHQVDITLTVAEFRVVELIVSDTIFILNNRKRFERLAEDCQFRNVDRDFAHLRTEDIALNTNEVADIEQTFENGVVHILVLARAEVVTADINLDTSFTILDFCERSLTHHTASHQTACDRNFLLGSIVLKVVFQIGRIAGNNVFGSRVWFNTHSTEFLQALATKDFLFAQI